LASRTASGGRCYDRDVVRRLALLMLIAAAFSCKHETPPAPPAPTETPVAAPATLVAEGTLREPDAFWGRLRKGGGAALAGSPDSAAGVILERAGVDPGLAPLVSGGQPFHVALGDAPDGMAFAIAMKLVDLQTVRSTLVESETARYKTEEVAGMIRLVPRDGTAPHLAVAVTWSGYLVMASSESDLGTLGAYAARTLPSKPLPASAFELRFDPAALGRAGKKAPDFATKITAYLAAMARSLLPPEVDASALAACFTPGIRDTTATAGDLAEARVVADADDARLDVVATLVPKAGDNAARKRLAAMHPASAGPLLDAPRDAIAALFWSDTAEQRAGDATALGPCVGKALAPILGPGGGQKLADLLASWARGRGDWETASFVAKSPAAGLVVRAPVADGGVASSTVRGFVDLASQPSVADAIGGLLPLRAGAVESFDVPRVGKASVVMFPPPAPLSHGVADASAPGPELAPPGMAWAVDGKEADVALGLTPRDLLALARPATPLRTNLSIEHAIGALGADASFAAIVEPPGCCAGAGPASAPLTFGWGRHEGNGRVTLAIGDELFGQLFARATAP
jgi:hypothetical protein